MCWLFFIFSSFALGSSPFYVPFDKQLRQVIPLLICLSFGKQQIQNNRLLNCSYLLIIW
ncbi:hypothetical protein GV230_05935 [Streptococcus pneumoniae]|nr:hypothetical protein [Streptococcus pneumoniae]NMG86832.1 hypothetical protein [Streptococcus pneumoniae]